MALTASTSTAAGSRRAMALARGAQAQAAAKHAKDLKVLKPAMGTDPHVYSGSRPASRRCSQKVHLSAVCVSWLMKRAS